MSARKLTLGVLVSVLFVAAARADDDVANPAETTLLPIEASKTDPGPVATVARRPDINTVSVTKSHDKAKKSEDADKVEKVIDRYPDGKVHVERDMVLDGKGNYINQGSYKMFDTDGQVVREGDFFEDRQQGPWVRRFAKDEGHLFSPSTDDDYTGPFTSEATFLDGQLQGVWTIKDSAGQKIVEWNFDKGVRSGPWTFWHSNGKKRLEATYRGGALNGNVIEYDRDEKEISRVEYVDGKRTVKVISYYALGQKRLEGFNLRSDNSMEATYDWWHSTVSLAPATATGLEQKHGVWISWHRNGNKESQAQYDHDTPIGKFQWWYENGQPKAEGSYDNGKKIGAWITWYPNGQKESLGEYQNDRLAGIYSHWDADGKLIDSKTSTQATAGQQIPVRTGANDVNGRRQ